MKLTYEEFMDMIPEETKGYVKKVLRYLNYYVTENNEIDSKTHNYNFEEDYRTSNSQIYKTKLLLSALIGLAKDPKMSLIVCKYGFDTSKLEIKHRLDPISIEEEKAIFDSCHELFCFHSDHTKYSTLLPIDIGANALKIPTLEIKTQLFNYYDVENKIQNAIKQLSIDEHTKQESEKEIIIYEDLPYDTINYIETASKIRTILINKLSESSTQTENEYIKKDDNYLVPLSLLLAIFEYDVTDKNIIEKYFNSKGITHTKIYEKIWINLTSTIKDTPRNMESIEMIYKKYWTEGKNKDKANKDVNIVDIVNNLFDRNFTKSIIIEKVLNEFKKDIKEFSNMGEQIEIYKNLNENFQLDEDTKTFYSKIRRDTKEFIVFSCKAYQVLLKKIKTSKHNTELLSKEDDVDSLAIYIASHFYQTDIDNFYNSHGVTFEEIMKLLNIQITKEEIETEILDKNILLNRFKRYVIEGINYRKNSENITINDVSLNLCNRDFNKSMIMENIFEEIRRDINLPNNFLSILNDFIEKQKKKINHKEKEEYFKNLPIEDLTYLTNVCKSYKGLINKTNIQDRYCDDLIIVLSLLLGLDNLKNNKTKELFENIGISLRHIYSYFGISNTTDGELDIQLLKTKFNKYIYEGRNKGNNSPTIQDIALNIFNDELYKSTELVEYLFKCGLNYAIFEDPKKLIEEFENKLKEAELKKIQEEKNKEAQRTLMLYPDATKNWINNAVYHYNQLMYIYRKDKDKYKEISSEEDIEILSLIIAIANSTYIQAVVFRKHNLNIKNILEFLNLPEQYQIGKIDNAENTLADVFSKYIQDSDKLIQSLSKNEFYQKIINKFVENKIIFEKELITGKDYKETLTLPERIELIKNSPLETLELTNMVNVQKFGSSLELHTTYIQDEYPKLMQSDEVSIATQEIKKLIDSVYTETEITEEPKGFFQKLLGAEKTIRKEVKVNKDVINSLKPNIEIQIKKLHAEAQKLTELKEYMEEYYKKNQEYIKILETNLTELNKQLKTTNTEDIFKIYDLKSYITILENKIKTLKLTDVLIKQEYIKINQVIVNHCITIESLLMSRNTLLPLIGTEMLIGAGINTEKESIDVTKNILTLLNDLISQDVAGTKEVLEKLKNTSISEEQLLLITKFTNDQINQINAAKLLEPPTEISPLTLEIPSPEFIQNNNTLDINERKLKKIL